VVDDGVDDAVAVGNEELEEMGPVEVDLVDIEPKSPIPLSEKGYNA
jgi:hypothetical protein